MGRESFGPNRSPAGWNGILHQTSPFCQSFLVFEEERPCLRIKVRFTSNIPFQFREAAEVDDSDVLRPRFEVDC